MEKALELPCDQLHRYTPAPGLPQCWAAVAESLGNRRFGMSYEGKDVFMTVGAAASLTSRSTPLRNQATRLLLSPHTFREVSRVD